jgi:hypothetical protein
MTKLRNPRQGDWRSSIGEFLLSELGRLHCGEELTATENVVARLREE